MKRDTSYGRWLVIVLVLLMIIPGFFAIADVLPGGVPRNEALILDSINGRLISPYNFNVWRINAQIGEGQQQLMAGALWYVDHGTGKFINSLAATAPTYSNDYKKVTIKIRKGLYWSDGVEFTANDVVFTINYSLDHPGLQWSAVLSKWVKKAYAVDEFTMVIELKEPNPRFHYILTCDIWWGLYIMPKHVFVKVKNPGSFNFYPPVSIGPYVLKDVDPNGYWISWERREDWNRTSVGVLEGKPGPKYIMFMDYGTVEKKIFAQMRHQLDWIFNVSPQGWDVLMKDKWVESWSNTFPWLFTHDPTPRGIYFNDSVYPFNNKWVRWSLALGTNMYQIMTQTYGGRQILMPTCGGSGLAPFKAYQLGMRDWLTNFSFPDGFKPFNPNLPHEIEKWAKTKGYKISGNPLDIWGPGWWKYAPEEAAKLLEEQGFKKDSSGKWHLPNGKLWTVTLNVPAFSEIDATMLGMAVAEQWKNFGINVVVQSMQNVPWGNALNTGDFEAGTYWGNYESGIMNDLWYTHYIWSDKYYQPNGKVAVADQMRWKNAEATQLLEKMGALPPTSPEIKELNYKFLKLLVEEMPIIPTTDCAKYSPHDTYYWTGFPTFEDPYWSVLFWCGGFKWITPHLKPTGR